MKLLIIRLSSIGDIVLTTPVLRCLKKQLPDSEIHFLVKKKYSEVLLNNPYIDKLLFFENDLNATISRLKSENYKLIIDLHKNLRSHLIRWKLRKKTFTFPKLTFRKFLYAWSKINILPDKHIVDRYFEAVRSIGIVNDNNGCDFYLTDEENKQAEYISEQNGITRFIAFSIGGTFFTKRMPEEKLSRIADRLNLPVIILGGKEDYERGEKIAEKSVNKVINLCGKLSLRMSAAVLNRSVAVLTNDTGLMHIAAALDKKIISLWGNTVPGFGMYPYFADSSESISKSEMIEVKGLKCRPCSKLGKQSCPKLHFNCMNNLDENYIVLILNKTVNSHN